MAATPFFRCTHHRRPSVTGAQLESFARDVPEHERYTLPNVRKLMGFEQCPLSSSCSDRSIFRSHPTLTSLSEHPGVLQVIRKMLVAAGAAVEEVQELEVRAPVLR